MEKLALTLPGSNNIEDPLNNKFTNIGSFFSGETNILPYVFVFAGLTLFIFLIIGGFGILTSAGSPDKMKAAQGKITSAIIGFVIIFISYWLVRILEIMLGISILS
jgi:hypothetical protein